MHHARRCVALPTAYDTSLGSSEEERRGRAGGQQPGSTYTVQPVSPHNQSRTAFGLPANGTFPFNDNWTSNRQPLHCRCNRKQISVRGKSVV
jgi:hypothetical protein